VGESGSCLFVHSDFQFSPCTNLRFTIEIQAWPLRHGGRLVIHSLYCRQLCVNFLATEALKLAWGMVMGIGCVVSNLLSRGTWA